MVKHKSSESHDKKSKSEDKSKKSIGHKDQKKVRGGRDTHGEFGPNNTGLGCDEHCR